MVEMWRGGCAHPWILSMVWRWGAWVDIHGILGAVLGCAPAGGIDLCYTLELDSASSCEILHRFRVPPESLIRYSHVVVIRYRYGLVIYARGCEVAAGSSPAANSGTSRVCEPYVPPYVPPYE
ncbi:hypothetical protein P154DRAFT_184954 [Amniculicola lignicola CBS 123094]|uniref:Uncharacterized protein n=1 Tax=Amniculicola lignicola CBS 123094 TaxID=1392246 RepID=A0A6A5WLG8_9PLEO|nr:hypothetical protein P154DRAFT_184954 [Amniculicola lignicola CBS 123094]